jgi:hypothetical protein
LALIPPWVRGSRARRLGSFLREFIDVQHQVDYPPTNQLDL